MVRLNQVYNIAVDEKLMEVEYEIIQGVGDTRCADI